MKHQLPTISVVTPSFNQGEFLEACIDSVLGQNYPHLEYIIVDGGSTDNSVDIIKKYQKYLAWWRSEPDDGQYHAVQEGLSRATGDVMTWINSSDLLLPNALNYVSSILATHPEIEWIGGRPNLFDRNGNQFRVWYVVPIWHRQRYLNKDFEYIQQEGVFWRRSLWEKAGGQLNLQYELAGDLELWARFFRYAKFYSCEGQIAGFRYHDNQRAKAYQRQYLREAEKILDAEIELVASGRSTTILPPASPISMAEVDQAMVECGLDERLDLRQLNQLAADFRLVDNQTVARDKLLKALELDHRSTLTNQNLGRTYLALGDNFKAICHSWKAHTYAPEDSGIVIHLGEAFSAAGRISEAKSLYQEYLERFPSHEKVRNELRQLQTAIRDGEIKEYFVTAIVSTYNSEYFLAGCLNNIEKQSLKKHLEVIVVDSGSHQRGREIVKDFQARYDNIVYIRTEAHESVYAAWNRAIRQARGKYITNANTDDRRTLNSMEYQVEALDRFQDVALVYGDLYITESETDVMAPNIPKGLKRHLRPDYAPLVALKEPLLTCQLMWRHTVHDELGYFDESFKIAGDYDFFLKVALQKGALLIRHALGVYYQNQNGMERTDLELLKEELSRARLTYINEFPITSLFPLLKTEFKGDKEAEASAWWEAANVALDAAPAPEYAIALNCFRKALELRDEKELQYNASLCEAIAGDSQRGTAALGTLAKALPAAGDALTLLKKYKDDPKALLKSDERLQFFRQTTEHAVCIPAKTGKGVSLQELVPIPSKDHGADRPMISAIVSTYNSERFMRACLEDLEAQTIADRLEIVVVDAASEQNEREIVTTFQEEYDNIIYIRAPRRLSVYEAWNLGIRASRGKYLTSANTDDRHKSDALERLVNTLETRNDISLVYANVWVTDRENETFEEHTRISSFVWAEFDPLSLLEGCYIGPQPVWRREIHDRHGHFDETFESAGDWEFWLRVSRTDKFLHVNEFLGLYLKSPTSVEHRDKSLSYREFERVKERYLPYKNKVLERRLQIARGLAKDGDLTSALDIVRHILDIEPDHVRSIEYVGDLCKALNDVPQALQLWQTALMIEPQNHKLKDKMRMTRDIESLFIAGRDLVANGNLEKGLKILTQVLDRDPHHQPTVSMMCQVYETLGLDEKAEELQRHLDQISGNGLEIDRENTPSKDMERVEEMFAEGTRLIESGNLSEGLRRLSQLLDLNPHHEPTIELVATVYEQLGLKSESKFMRDLQREMQSADKHEQVKKDGSGLNDRYEAGVRLIAEGQYANGLVLLKSIIDSNPTHLPTMKVMADLYDRLGEQEESKALERLIEKIETEQS